ncbi:MAG: hypothetical protein KZQ73_13490, partial [Candidatus Thiodiazotropha sp. (ex Semelilucina semeliformis)]|nr:hypothetical protein [Candidatus Thiodiazotropha sp. (ex Semelilucina semeliformis)]
MTGDGSLDLVQINNGRVVYFPQIGNGHFGDGVEMADAPFIDDDQAFDHARLRFVDLDGSGTSDILYIGRGKLHYWINACGNRFVDSGTIDGLPFIDNVSNVKVLDFLGNGIPCLVWSSPLLNNQAAPLHYLELTEATKPRLLKSVDNSLGRRIELEYGTSSEHYLRDKNGGNPWVTKLPTHRTVVNRKIIFDEISQSRIVTRFAYHDGHFDSETRSFRGFGLVDQYDSEHLEALAGADSRSYSSPSCTRTWLHNGELGWFNRRATQFYQADSEHHLLPGPFLENPERFDNQEFAEAYHALAGQLVRQEVYAVEDDGQLAEHPFQVLQRAYRVRRLQPEIVSSTKRLKPVLYVYQSESLSHDYEQQPTDPRISHHLSLSVDEYGYIRRDCDINYPRSSTISPDTPLQQAFHLSCSQVNLIHLDEKGRYQLGIPIEERAYEIRHLTTTGDRIFGYEEILTGIDTALTTPLAFHESYAPDSSGVPQARLVNWDQSYYWNDDRDAPLALGSLGQRVLIHHEESACFSSDWMTAVYGGLVNNNLLQTDGLYHLRDDYWWQQDPINHYLDLDGFYLVSHEQQADGSLIHYQYDPYSLVLQQITDSLGNRVNCEIDYHLLTPKKITDFNDNFSEVLHDPLGVIIATSNRGQIVDAADTLQPYGNGLIAHHTLHTDASFDNFLSNPSKYLQELSQRFHYELDSWEVHNQPTRSITLVREDFLHDGRGNINNAPEIGIFVNYF